MAAQTHTIPSRFHNLSAERLADEIGRVDAIQKAAEAELTALKDEFKGRGLQVAAGDNYTVTAAEQIAGRFDVTAARAFLGAAARRFEVPVVTTVVRIKSAARRLAVAA